VVQQLRAFLATKTSEFVTNLAPLIRPQLVDLKLQDVLP
jgi:hypothetical protein